MTERDMVRQTLVELLEADTGEKYDELKDDTSLREGLGLDSVDALEIAAMLSAHFAAEITEQDSSRYREILANVRSLATFVRECQAANA